MKRGREPARGEIKGRDAARLRWCGKAGRRDKGRERDPVRGIRREGERGTKRRDKGRER